MPTEQNRKRSRSLSREFSQYVVLPLILELSGDLFQWFRRFSGTGHSDGAARSSLMAAYIIIQKPGECLNHGGNAGPYLPVRKETLGDGELAGDADIGGDAPDGKGGGDHGGRREQSTDGAGHVAILSLFAVKRATLPQLETQTHTETISASESRFSV